MCGWGTCKSFTTYLKSGKQGLTQIYKCSVVTLLGNMLHFWPERDNATKIDMIHKGRYSRALIIIQVSFYYVQEDEDFAC